MDSNWIIEIQPQYQSGLQSAFVGEQKTCDASSPQNVHKEFKLAAGETATIILEAPIGETGKYDIKGLVSNGCYSVVSDYKEYSVSGISGTIVSDMEITTTRTPQCGDGFCGGSETFLICPDDCYSWCGDGICNPIQETENTCPEDCKEQKKEISIYKLDTLTSSNIGEYACDEKDECPSEVCYIINKPATQSFLSIFTGPAKLVNDILDKILGIDTSLPEWAVAVDKLADLSGELKPIVKNSEDLQPVLSEIDKQGVCISDWDYFSNHIMGEIETVQGLTSKSLEIGGDLRIKTSCVATVTNSDITALKNAVEKDKNTFLYNHKCDENADCCDKDEGVTCVPHTDANAGFFDWDKDNEGFCMKKFNLIEWIKDTIGIDNDAAAIGILAGAVIVLLFILNMLFTPPRSNVRGFGS